MLWVSVGLTPNPPSIRLGCAVANCKDIKYIVDDDLDDDTPSCASHLERPS